MWQSDSDSSSRSNTNNAATAAPHAIRDVVDDDTIRVMLSTDNHLGYAESDAVRGMDSFAAFEEVLHLARLFHCDMVLIAGDLFHDNRPSRRTLHKTMEILRRYCMGPGAVKIQIVSDAARNFRSHVVNYMDENYSVDLPVFSIHGNHDDPSRDKGDGELLAALDMLSVSNLVNYFGRQDQIDKVRAFCVYVRLFGISKWVLVYTSWFRLPAMLYSHSFILTG
jgi:double-strand break repair protein MRE11